MYYPDYTEEENLQIVNAIKKGIECGGVIDESVPTKLKRTVERNIIFHMRRKTPTQQNENSDACDVTRD